MLRTVVFALALPVLGSARLAAQLAPAATAAAPEVVATGYGEADARPDRARLVLAVVTRAPSAAEAGRLNAARTAPVLAALRRLGLADSTVTTDGYTVDADDEEPGTPPAARRPRRAYVARNAVRVTLRQLDRLGAVVDTSLGAGATEVGEVTFESSETPAARRRAIAAATAAARADAEAAATALGARLGPVIEVAVDPSEAGAYGMLVRSERRVRRAGPAQTEITAGALTAAAQVRIRASLVRPAP